MNLHPKTAVYLIETATELKDQRDDLLKALKALRALVRDLGVQDADDAWYEAVEHADAAIARATDK